MSCLGEALERLSGIFRGDEPRRSASYREIGGEAIQPDALTLFSESQFQDREQWNRREGGYNWVPERFDSRRNIDWSPAWSLTEARTKYLPTAYCYFGYPFDPGHDFCRPDSNGNAAGRDLDEAIVHGFLELVERECASVWWYNRVPRPRVDVESFASHCAGVIRNLFQLFGRRFEVLDITLDRSIPAFVALSCSEEPSDDYILGFGAHFDARAALTRALMEITQFLPAVASSHSPGCFLRAENRQTDKTFLLGDDCLPSIQRSCFPPSEVPNPKQDLLACIEVARSWGLEMLVLDQTRGNLGMPVVKVVVPGMRSWWARFAPGRLYALPVNFGWLTGAKTETELNPDHLVL